jgi:glutamine synthetase
VEHTMSIVAEYLWIDGSKPTQRLRSKTKIMHGISLNDHVNDKGEFDLSIYPNWQFDGSSTGQAVGDASDCVLRPVRTYPDPIRGLNSVLVLCEVDLSNGDPHPSNARASLRKTLDQGAAAEKSWFGYEQEYTFYDGSRPLGFSSDFRFPAAQGPYYCGVGADEVHGRDVVEHHMEACIDAGLSIQGVNAEVMPGQWEFQMGGPDAGALKASDDLWVGRWLLYRIGEEYSVTATLDPKPVPGDWNGAGMHTNFSTETMRKPGGMKAINDAIKAFSNRIQEHLAAYGFGYEMRLTGHHETCRYDEFKSGVSDRTASIRIPANVAEDGYGYLEDRRPNANADPYEVADVILKSVCHLHK